MRGTRDGLICPWRVIDDCGSGFQMGTIGGSIFYFLRGELIYNISNLKDSYMLQRKKSLWEGFSS
jgi:hypothetical protein